MYGPRMGDKTEYQRAYNNGMTVAQMRAFFDLHGRKCGICGTPWDPDKRGGGLAIDHDHACCAGRDPRVPYSKREARLCGKCARGLLCTSCNAAIGQFADRVDLLEAAIAYLKRDRMQLPDIPRRRARGEGHAMAKLTQAQVHQVRTRYAEGGVTQKALSVEYGVAEATIHRIIKRKGWV